MSSAVETRTVSAGQGRDVCLEMAGDRQGIPVLVHNGTPNSRHLYGPWIADAAAKGIHLIGYDRPGYGGSAADPGHTVASGAHDARAIAQALGLGRLGVWGISGGGPYALGCAALLPDVVVAAAVVASPAPYGEEGLDYFAGMGELNAEDTRLFFSDPEAARRKTRQDWEQFMAATPEQLAEGMKSLLSPVDAQALTGELAQWLAETAHDGLAAGDQGWWDDAVALLTGWGFDLEDIRVPVKIWHGRQDRFVPVQHGQWLAANVPGAEADISDDDGHLSLTARIGEIHDWLLQHFQDAPP